MKYFLILIFSLPQIGLATQDGECMASEAQRLEALRALVDPVNELLKTTKKEVHTVSDLDKELVLNADRAINQDYITISGWSPRHKMKNALLHYCIQKYLDCGHEGSSCYVSLTTGESACYPGGVVCTKK